jgi:hypothetical protein
MVQSWKRLENPLYDIYLEPVIDLGELSKYATEYNCNYVVIDKERILEGGTPEEHELARIGATTHYDVYRNLKVDFFDAEE